MLLGGRQLIIQIKDLAALLEASGVDDQDVPPHQALAIRFGSGKHARTVVLDRTDGGDVVVDYDDEGRIMGIELL
jgi:hypothetical protein